MNQKNIIDAESTKLANNKLKLPPFIQRDRHHSETDNLTYNYPLNQNFNDLNDNNQLNQLIKLGSSAPNSSNLFFEDNFNDFSSNYTNKDYLNTNNDKNSNIYSDYSDLSDDDEKFSLASINRTYSKLNKKDKTSKLQDLTNEKNFNLTKPNFLQLPKSKNQISSSTGSIDLTATTAVLNQNANKRSRKSKDRNLNLVRKRKRCYSMDERRNYSKKDNFNFDSMFSFDNLAFNQNNLSDISEPLSSSEKSEKSTENLKNLQNMDNDKHDEKIKNILPIILINNETEYNGNVRFDLNANDDDDKTEDKDYLIENNFKSSRLDIELGSNESEDDLSDKNHDTIEFTTKLASDLSKPEIEAESLVSFVFQVMLPLLFCGLGNVIAGLLLNEIKDYEVLKEINELYIAIPCLMGLKGNLEMTMASRLSTAANLGILEHLPQILSITKSNICLLQCQATVVSLLASLIGVFSQLNKDEDVNIHNILLLITSNVVTANICCTLLSALMIGIILFCKHQSINPDNVAVPLASSLGDVSTVFLLGYISSILYESIKSNNHWLTPLILLIILFITPFSMIVAFRNKHTKKILKFGWLPIILSMLISSAAGIILDKVVELFSAFPLFQPIINGVGGNLAAIQASRIGTYLHLTTKFGHLPKQELSTIDSQIMENCGQLADCKNSESNFSELTNYIQLDEKLNDSDEFKDVDLNDNQNCNQNFTQNDNQMNLIDNNLKINNESDQLNYSLKSSIDYSSGNHKTDCFNRASYKTRKLIRKRRKLIKNYLKVIFSSGSIHQKTARLLILITLPMHILYFYLIKLIVNDQIFHSFPFFIIFYLMVALAQMSILLYFAKLLVYFLWKHRFDPDNWAIPLLTAFGDFIGAALLAVVFFTFLNAN